jgi:hypothetical protein
MRFDEVLPSFGPDWMIQCTTKNNKDKENSRVKDFLSILLCSIECYTYFWQVRQYQRLYCCISSSGWLHVGHRGVCAWGCGGGEGAYVGAGVGTYVVVGGGMGPLAIKP